MLPARHIRKWRSPKPRLRNASFDAWRSLLAILVCVVCTQWVAAEDTQSVLEDFPGQRFSIGSHSLHLDCRGHGSPTVILESGLGGFSAEWHHVHQQLSSYTRVCAYDRSGYGWSDVSRSEPNAMQSANELHTLLQVAAEKAPYLLVGHSYGGFIVRLFAERFSHLVNSMVLLDASAPEQFQRMPANALPGRLLHAVKRGVRIFSVPRPVLALPEPLRISVMQLMMLPKARQTYLAEMRNFERSANRVARQADGSLHIPVVIVTRSRNPISTLADDPNAGDQVWQDMQRRMTQLSSHADHWIAAGAGHLIHTDRPDLTMLAIRQAAQADSKHYVWAESPMVRTIFADNEAAATVSQSWQFDVAKSPSL